MPEAGLTNLKGLGPKSVECLHEVGVHTLEELRQLGSVRTFLKLQRESRKMKPSLNFLYALEGAIQDVHWQHIAKYHREHLVMELDALQALDSGTN